jgi:GTPase
MFHDRARIHVQAGRGGDGALSFRREKFVPKGGPDGGDGGDGGGVVLVADPDLRDLSALAARRRLKAGRGRNGGASRRHGARGDEAIAKVAVGTQVYDEDGQLIADLASPEARAVVARGGAGGRGNARFASATRQVPRFAETGRPGEEAELELRLKLLADAALVGLPNAGKSSLLRRLSNAKPKVAEYPFTTLAPVLGTLDSPDRTRQLTVADVPGLIEGASLGVGLGHEFLAHLERARTLIHVIDAAAGDPADAFRAIDGELAAYGAGLDALPQIVVLNDDPRVSRVFRISCATGEGVDALKRALFELVEPAEPPASADAEGLVDFLVYRPKPGRPAYRILRTDLSPQARAARVPHPPHRPGLPRHRLGAGGRGAGSGAEDGWGAHR